MKKNIFTVLFLLFCLIFSNGQDYKSPNSIILKLKNEYNASGRGIDGAEKVFRTNKLFSSQETKKVVLSEKSNQVIYTVKFPEGTDLQKVIDEYYKTGEIEYAEPDYPVYIHGTRTTVSPDDEYYYRQWALKNDGTFSTLPAKPGADISMEKAWEIEQGSSNIIVAVIDTGVNWAHSEFENRIWINKGWNFADNNDDLTDINGHGTNVAGIIGANANNSIGYAGVDRNCKLMILRVFDSAGNGIMSYVVAAINYAVDNGARVINLSLGGTGLSITLQNAVNYALANNVVVVASMGNENYGITQYPAGFPGVIAVGSTNPNDTRSDPFYNNPSLGSNYGNHISVVAPGNLIYGLSHTSKTDYSVRWSGTSQSAPHVAGLASLLLAQNPNRTPAQIKNIIEETAEDQVGDSAEDVPGWDIYYGHGRINAWLALSHYMSAETFNLKHEEIKIFPNPAKQNFTADFPLGTQQIDIFNPTGQLIISKKVSGLTSQNFSISGSGVFFIRFTFEKGEKTTEKVIISQ
ncbi:MAG: S8 family serine peptidase [Flavobacteriaceae bacterium]|jgi:subtilisin family serine protease|nr:S8 family serine peptidase [Flavobacteriaceae bacterium]